MPGAIGGGHDMPEDFTEILRRVREGDRNAANLLVPVVYDELRRIAGAFLRSERYDHTLQPTALVNEAYLRLVRERDAEWDNRAQFMAIAARQMRRVLVDHARAKVAGKRGGGAVRVEFDAHHDIAAPRDADLVALDDALADLALQDARLAQVVELRYFGGLTVEETADVLGVSTATVNRDWATARAWLRRAIRRGE
jgi:RNA polymerase sigma factor (TIGR02999 family)